MFQLKVYKRVFERDYSKKNHPTFVGEEFKLFY